MVRMFVTAGVRATVTVGVAAHFRHELAHALAHKSVDLVGVALAAFASWFGLPGPGEPVLIAASIGAAHHHLSIGVVILVAFVAAAAGGWAGWLVGLKFGGIVQSPRGPLKRLRRSALDHGEAVFRRAPTAAILLTPSFVAGIHRVRSRVYQPVNLIAAAVWAVAIGLGGYWAGPPVLDLVNDLGLVIGSILVAVVAAAVVIAWRRRHRRPSLESGA